MKKQKKLKSSNFYDPELSRILSIIEESGQSISRIAFTSGISTSTLYNWRKGKTSRPQNCTINFAAKACGYERIWRKVK